MGSERRPETERGMDLEDRVAEIAPTIFVLAARSLCAAAAAMAERAATS